MRLRPIALLSTLALAGVLLALLLGAGALGAAAQQVSLQDASADAARLLGRGEDAGAAAGVIGAAVPGAGMTQHARGDLVCVTATSEFTVGRVIRVPLRASSCALSGGK